MSGLMSGLLTGLSGLASALGALWSGFKTWGALGVIIFVLLGANWLQYREGRQAREQLGQVTVALSLAQSGLEQLRRLRAEEAQLVADMAGKQDELETTSRKLQRQLREALRNAKNIDPNAVLPDSIVDALCLRRLAAAGGKPAKGNSPGSAYAGTDHPPADSCDRWRGKLTLADVVEWTGLLLDHAGAERLDKAGLRQWAGDGGQGNISEGTLSPRAPLAGD